MITYKQAERQILDSNGYANHAIMADSEVLCLKCLEDEKDLIIESENDLMQDIGSKEFERVQYSGSEQWVISMIDSHWEVSSEDDTLYCDHCYHQIQPVYSED